MAVARLRGRAGREPHLPGAARNHALARREARGNGDPVAVARTGRHQPALEALAAYDGRKDHGGDRRREIEEEYRFAMAGARVFGSPTIDAALLEVREVVKPFLTPGASPPDDWREDLAERVETLANEMRSDLHE